MPSPLIRDMIDKYHYPVLGNDDIDEFLVSHDDVVLFFAENPMNYPESNDVAVVLPELMKVFEGRLTTAVISQTSERELFRRYNFKGWPSLVFVRRGEYLGVISRVQDWHVYIDMIEDILRAEPSAPPAIEIPLVQVQANQ